MNLQRYTNHNRALLNSFLWLADAFILSPFRLELLSSKINNFTTYQNQAPWHIAFSE